MPPFVMQVIAMAEGEDVLSVAEESTIQGLNMPSNRPQQIVPCLHIAGRIICHMVQSLKPHSFQTCVVLPGFTATASCGDGAEEFRIISTWSQRQQTLLLP